jgi:serine/threonine protein kinase
LESTVLVVHESRSAALFHSRHINPSTHPRIASESSGVYGTTNYNNRHSDIYSLGILLVQLVTGHTPWDTPTASDQYYTYFLYHPDTFFTEVFPLSQQAAALLAGCLHPRPHRRISLSMLIAQLRSLERWYMTDDELAQAHPTLRRFDDVRRVRARVVGDGMLLTPPESPVLTQDRTLMDIAEEVAAFAIADSDDSDDEEEPESTSRYPMSEVRSE